MFASAGSSRIRLRGQKGSEGDARYGTTITLTVLFGPLGLLKHGKDVEIKTGQRLTAFVDQDAAVTTPISAPGAAAPTPATTGTSN